MSESVVSRYWKIQKITEENLGKQHGDCFYIITVEQPLLQDWKPGVISLVTKRLGAMRIVDGTHRVATPEEIAAYLEKQAEQAVLIQETEDRRAKRQVVSVAPATPRKA